MGKVMLLHVEKTLDTPKRRARFGTVTSTHLEMKAGACEVRDKIRTAYRAEIRDKCRASLCRYEQKFLRLAEAGYGVSHLIASGCPQVLADALVLGIHQDERLT